MIDFNLLNTKLFKILEVQLTLERESVGDVQRSKWNLRLRPGYCSPLQ